MPSAVAPSGCNTSGHSQLHRSALALDDIVVEIKFSVMQKHLPFPRSRRLTIDSEFQRVRTEGFSIRGEILTIGFLRNAEAGAARAGFITSRRVGSAVVRNRTRRRLRE